MIGRSFDLDTARTASGRSDEEVVAAFEELTARGLVREVAGDAYDFGHGLMRELVYQETSLARRRLLHGRVGEALAGRARGRRSPPPPAAIAPPPRVRRPTSARRPSTTGSPATRLGRVHANTER